jgi:hypothetical protein
MIGAHSVPGLERLEAESYLAVARKPFRLTDLDLGSSCLDLAFAQPAIYAPP